MTEVLVVDDSRFMVKAVSAVLEGLGYHVVAVAHDGEEGLEKFQQYRPDVTLLDVTMPNMDGLECLQEVLALDAEARVVMFSAVKDQDIVDKCLNAGAVAFLQKPIRPTEEEDLDRLRSTLETAVQQVG